MQEVLDIVRSVLRSVWVYRWWGIAAAIAAGAVGSAWVMALPEQYEARARVYVDTQSILRPLMSGLAVQPNIDQQLVMMSRTLISRPNIDKVVRMTDLDLKVHSPKERDAMIDGIIKRLQFSEAGGYNLFQITFRDGDPQMARKIVQSFLSLFVEANLGDKRRDTDQAIKFLDDQINIYQQRLTEAENRLKEFRIRNLLDNPGVGPDAIARTSDLQSQLAQAKMDLSQAQNARDELRKQLSVEPPQVADDRPFFEIPGTGGSAIAMRHTPYDDRIEAQRKRLDELRLRYTEDFPDVVATKRVIKELEAARDKELKAEAKADAKNGDKGAARGAGMSPNPVYQQLKVSLADAEATVASLGARVRGLENRIAQARASAALGPKIDAEYQQLTRTYDITKRNYEQLVARKDSAVMSSAMDSKASVADFRIVDPPRVSPRPVFPNRPAMLTGVLVASLLIGIGVAFLRDQVRPTVLDLRTLGAVAGVPLLGAVSLISDAAAHRRARRNALAFAGVATAYVGIFAVALAWSWLHHISRA